MDGVSRLFYFVIKCYNLGMAQWKESFAPPEKFKDPYFINTSYGGYSPCIIVDDGGWTLPNCVAWCYGDWYRILGYDPMFSLNNADTWYGSSRDDFKRGTVSEPPRVGDVVCYSGNGTGHVACVEEVISDDECIISQSAYGRYEPHQNYWRRSTIRRSSGWHPYGSADGYYIQGWIRFPSDEPPTPPTPTPTSGKLFLLDPYGGDIMILPNGDGNA